MGVETINVDNVKQTEATKKEEEKMEQKKDKKLNIKIAKTKPMNSGGACTAVIRKPEYQCTEYKDSIPIGIIEIITKTIPKYADVNKDQLRDRLLRSPDLCYLFSQLTGNLNIENDAVKLILTLISHIGNEILSKKLNEQEEESTT
jgi:hypothetical protein